MQAFNPYLPLNEYIPDGEPHVFGDRVYVYGSHDESKAEVFCAGHYNVWSASVDNLKEWRDEGTVYYRTQDPTNADDVMQLWAPDVTQGPDGRFYLYYCLSFYPEIGVAVADHPAGPFVFYGHVKYSDEILGGKNLAEDKPFDPAVLTDEDGRVYLYYGFAPACENEFSLPEFTEDDLKMMTPEMCEKLGGLEKIEVGEYSMVVELEKDMLTMKGRPQKMIPGGHHTDGTGFEGHGFFEASSIRKIRGKYYFVYSSHKGHELCYAVSDHPMKDYVYGGTIVSNGDIGIDGRSVPVNQIGNNHGGILQVKDDFYIFYHRQTNGTEFSRQGCAEKIIIQEDGSIEQVEITSCGLNGGPLTASGSYPAAIACHLTDEDGDSISGIPGTERVRIAQEGYEQYISGIKAGTTIGYKYFDFSNLSGELLLEMRGDFLGEIQVTHELDSQKRIGVAACRIDRSEWSVVKINISPDEGSGPLYLQFAGKGRADLKTLIFYQNSL